MINEPYLVYDIETYPCERAEAYWSNKKVKTGNTKDPVKLEAAIKQKRAEGLKGAALSPITGRITCIALSYCGDYKVFINRDETVILNQVNNFIQNQENGRGINHFVAHNAAFDLKFLRLRHLHHRMQLPDWLSPFRRHEDTMKLIDWRDMTSLGDIEWLLDIKREIGAKDSTQVFEWWETGDFETLEKHALGDIQTTEHLWLSLSGYYHKPKDY